MSEQLKHECGIAMIRLLKPLDWYKEKYGTAAYGLNNLYLLMEKQHNRGQEGAGIACVKLDSSPGEEYIFRSRAMGSGAIGEVFSDVHNQIAESASEGVTEENRPFLGELYLGHLRYRTPFRHIICPPLSPAQQLEKPQSLSCRELQSYQRTGSFRGDRCFGPAPKT